MAFNSAMGDLMAISKLQAIESVRTFGRLAKAQVIRLRNLLGGVMRCTPFEI